MLTGPIIVRAATAEDIPFMRVMIWEAMLASPTFLAMHGVENLQQLEEDYKERFYQEAKGRHYQSSAPNSVFF